MGLLKRVRQFAAVTLGGHQITAPIAKVAPKLLGLKSEAARSTVAVTQKALIGSGIAAVGGSALMSANAVPLKPASTQPVDVGIQELEELFIRHLLRG